jgi:outer membrane protein assembly factor BamB
VAGALGRIRGLFAIVGVLSIGIIYAIVTGWNPLPGWADWLQNISVTKLSTPAPLWTARVGNQPNAATVLPTGIVISTGGSVEVRNPGAGTLVWSREDSWAGVAGGAQPVVLVGRPVKAGFDVYDLGSGVFLWGENDKAGVWAYQDKILILTCGKTCTLKAVSTADGVKLWSTEIPADGSTRLMGFNHGLAGVGPVASAFAGPAGALPGLAPHLIGLPMAGKVRVIDTRNGHPQHVFTPDDATRIVVAGDYVVASSASMRSDQCYYQATGMDPATGRQLWQQPGIDLRTSTPLGCEAANNPVGVDADLVAIDTSGRDVVIDSADRSVVFRTDPGERIVAMDAKIAIVRKAGGRAIRAFDLATGHALWSVDLAKSAAVGIAADYVVVADPTQMGSITIYSRQAGVVETTVKSNASVLGFGPASVLLNIGRTIGPLSVASMP